MATIKGLWKLNSQLDCSVVIYEYVNYSCHFGEMAIMYIHNNSPSVAYLFSDSMDGNIADGKSVYYNGGWGNSLSRTVDFGETEQEVSDEFYAWFTANAIAAKPITYNGIVLANILPGQTATLACDGKKSLGDIVVEACVPSLVTYNGKKTIVRQGEKATLACAGKKMVSDVFVTDATHQLYNGLRLPIIPAYVLMNYPYLLIAQGTSGTVRIYGSTSTTYYYVPDDEKVYIPANRVRTTYDAETDAWGEAETATSATNLNLTATWEVLWSNHDIPNGSADATDIYFYGSEPVPTE